VYSEEYMTVPKVFMPHTMYVISVQMVTDSSMNRITDGAWAMTSSVITVNRGVMTSSQGSSSLLTSYSSHHVGINDARKLKHMHLEQPPM
jgi:hypothetical protein